MDRIELIKPTTDYKKQILGYRDEFLDNKETIHGGGGLERFDTFEKWLKVCADSEHQETIPKDRVPATQYAAIRASDGKVVGLLQIRHSLNDHLKLEGGHIGYSVRKSERRKGYGTEMLKAALRKCKELGITKVLLTCEPENIGSSSVMKANGGKFEKQVTLKDNSKLDHYWITLTSSKR